MKECSKAVTRRLSDPNFVRRYFVGHGVDLGGKPDPLALYQTMFDRITSVKTWDWEDGDAQLMAGVPDQTYDFVHSSHCLEHLVDPVAGLGQWMRICKEGGHLVITVPDEDLYEQGVWPSTFNRDHKWTFTIHKHASWCEKSLNVLDLVRDLGPEAELLRVELLSSTYRYELPRYDQTLAPTGECGIEFVIRRRPKAELDDRGRWRRPTAQPSAEILRHLNQHADDLRTLKRANETQPPFLNETPL
jgi:SAM-dependent methyltransferase